jgi:site-specific DNA recombinase
MAGSLKSTSHLCGAAPHNLSERQIPMWGTPAIAFANWRGSPPECAYDSCMVTGEVQKAKYIYYRCTGHRGKCDLLRFREEDIANRLVQPLKGLQVPSHIVSQIVATLREDRRQAAGKVSAEQSRLEARLTGIRTRMDKAYTDKLDGKIPEDFRERKMSDWRTEEQQVRMAIDGLANAESSDRALDAQRILELANKAYSL